MARVIILDAGVVISHLNPDDAFHRSATEFLEEYEEFEWAVNALTLAECLVNAVRGGEGVQMLQKVQRLSILQLDLAAPDALSLAETRAETDVKMPDAVVIWTAEHYRAELVTTDNALARAAEARGITAHLLAA